MSRLDKSAALEGENGMIRVLILGESAVSHGDLAAILREDGRFTVVQGDLRVVNLGTRASRAFAQPDVILLDSGSKQLASLPVSAADDGPPIVLLIDEISRGELIQALHSGVRGLLRRDSKPEELFAVIEAVTTGFTALGPEELDLLLPANRSDDVGQIVTEALSARESEVLALMSQGLANKNIADQLGISEHTVKFHVSSILSKLAVASRTEAVARGVRDGLIVI